MSRTIRILPLAAVALLPIVPAPAGRFVVHYADEAHHDGAKTEEAIIHVWGMGPATATPAEKR